MPVKTVFITGGSRGIGRAMVQAFKAGGYKVAACSVSGKGPGLEEALAAESQLGGKDLVSFPEGQQFFQPGLADPARPRHSYLADPGQGTFLYGKKHGDLVTGGFQDAGNLRLR